MRITAVVMVCLLAGCGDSPPPDTATSAITPQVTISDQQVSVRSGEQRLIVQREPLALRFGGADGSVALRQLPDANAAPMPIAAVNEPSILGSELPKTPTLYAPFSFVVGLVAAPQFPAGPWQANVLTGTAAGIAYHATAVNTAKAVEGGADLELATNDPTGRMLRLELRRAAHGGIRVSVRPEPATGVVMMADSFVAESGDAFRGFGGRHNALDQRGQDFIGWIQQQNLGAGYLAPVTDPLPMAGPSYMFPNGATAAYYIAPSFVSPRYGFLLERDEASRWRMASDADDRWQVAVAAAQLDYSVYSGTPMHSLPALSAVTGRHRPPPDWVLGVLLDRSTIAFTQTAAQYALQVREDLAQIDALGIRASGYRIEGWFKLAAAERAELIGEFKRRGLKVMTYFRPFAAIDGAGTEDPAVFTEALQQGYFTRNAFGLPYLFAGNFLGPTGLIDFTRPDAREWWKQRIKAALDEGADGFMQDFGEQVMSDMQFADGRSGALLHNRYPQLFHRLTREAIDEWRLAQPGRDDIWYYTRAGYAGIDGAAHDEGGNFAGDGNTDFSRSSGLAAQAPDMLNRALAGNYGFTTDIGGYFDFVTPPTSKELFIRWAEWAVFSPVMRLHGSIRSGTHMPWTYDEETVAIWKQLSALRYRAQPYLKRAWAEAHRSGIPLTRPLWLIYPDEPEAARQDQQWLLGEDLLVAPVVTEGASSRAVYFPNGCWQHGETGARYTGPASIEVAAPLASLPWFHRCGAAPF